MTAMGTHSRPIDGTVTANGHQLAPFTISQLQAQGRPVSVLPRPAPDRHGRSWTAPDGDTVIRGLAAAVVLAVAAFAAIVSYSHIFELGRQHGQDGTAARLLPLSVDGLIAAASLVMLHAARRKLDVPRLARAMLALGVAATIAANIFYGLPFGWLAAVVSAWPAVAFVGSVEMAVRFVRDARQDSGQPVVTPRHDSGHDKGDKPQRKQVTRTQAPAMTKEARAAIAIRDNPGLTNAELARIVGCQPRTISRARNGKA